MGFKEIASLDADKTIALGGKDKKTGKPNPTSVEGYYLGSREVENGMGKSKIHFFQTSKGNVGVWGKTDSDRKLAGVTPGVMTRISFTGMQSIPGKQPMYKYKVEVDNENTTEVSTASSEALSADGQEDAVDYGDNEFVSDEDTSDDEAEVNAAAIAAAERKAKVQALLGKGKKA